MEFLKSILSRLISFHEYIKSQTLNMILNIVIEWLALVLHIQDVPGWSLGPEEWLSWLRIFMVKAMVFPSSFFSVNF